MQHEGLAVIGAGFGRTGTLSLKAALEQLGFGPCYHMVEVFEHPDHLPSWEAAARSEEIDWRKLFAGYRASLDWPACTFYQELRQTFPDAMIILTVRDPERWYESVRATIFHTSVRGGNTRFAHLVARVWWTLVPRMRRMGRMHEQIIWDGTFDGNIEDKEYAIAVFNQHIEAVKHAIPPDKLLVYDVKEGWEPLCAFLGVAVPAQPFPHLNDRASFSGNRKRNQQERLAKIIGAGAVTAVALLAAWVFLRRKRS